MQISVFSHNGLSIKAPGERGPSDSAVQTIFIEFKRPESLGENAMDYSRDIRLDVSNRGASIGLNGFDVEQPEPFQLKVRPSWERDKATLGDPPEFPPPKPPEFEPPSSYQIMTEGVYAAAGQHEPIFYTKWFSIDGPERYFYHRKPDGSVECLGRMLHWGEPDRIGVEMPLGAAELREFASVYTAEDYVTHTFMHTTQA